MILFKRFFIVQLILVSSIFHVEVSAQEKVMLNTDRDIYIAGESIWLNVGAYQLDKNQSSKLSQVVYIELINNKNVPVLQLKYRVDTLNVQTQLLLSDTLSTGNYSLRAYTRWMRNKDNSLYAKKVISIINPFLCRSLPAGDKCFKNDTIFTFPESGILFPGVENNVMILAYNQLGRRKAIEGKLVDEDNKTLTSFKTNDEGYGSFKFIPEKNGTYFYCFDDRQVDLPAVSNEKVYLQLSKQNSGICTFNIHGEFKNNVWLDVVSEDGTFKRRYAVTSDGRVVVKDKDLKENILYALLIDDKNNILAYRAFSRDIKEELSVPRLKTDQQSYGRREKVNLKIDQIETLKNVSVSVVKTCLLNPNVSKSEFINFSENDALLAMKPPKFIGNNVGRVLLPESKGELITGRITSVQTGKPIVGEKFMLNFVSRTPIMKFSTTDSLGQFKFVVNRYGQEEMVIQPFSNDTSLLNYKVTIEEGFSPNYNECRNEPLVLDSTTSKRINEAIVNMQINTIFSSFRKNSSLVDSIQELVAFYGTPTESTVISKYIELPTVEEVVREVVPFVLIRRKNGEYFFKVYEGNSLYPRHCETMTFVDGVPIKNVKHIFEIPPQDLDKIEVVNLNFYLQDEELGYLLCFYTQNEDMADMEFDQRIFRQVHKGFINSYQYVSPNYSDSAVKKSRLADFRNVLYFNVFHQNKVPLKVSFYTSDEETEYTIVVKGINGQGKFVESRKEIVVSEDLKNP